MLGILQFITGTVWKLLFGAAADSLEKSVEEEDEFMIVERSPLVSHYISNAPCNCCAFVAGIVRGGCIPPLYLPYISPISPLHLPYISQVRQLGGAPVGRASVRPGDQPGGALGRDGAPNPHIPVGLGLGLGLRSTRRSTGG